MLCTITTYITFLFLKKFSKISQKESLVFVRFTSAVLSWLSGRVNDLLFQKIIRKIYTEKVKFSDTDCKKRQRVHYKTVS